MSPDIARLFDFTRLAPFAKVDFTAGCWLWTAAKERDGYGHAWLAGRRWRAHRLFYEWLVGPIPMGLQLDHLCREPACVRPDHLEAVTHRENMRRGHGFAGEHARKTHCARGHPFSGSNLAPRGNGRACRTCQREANRRCYAKGRHRLGS